MGVGGRASQTSSRARSSTHVCRYVLRRGGGWEPSRARQTPEGSPKGTSGGEYQSRRTEGGRAARISLRLRNDESSCATPPQRSGKFQYHPDHKAPRHTESHPHRHPDPPLRPRLREALQHLCRFRISELHSPDPRLDAIGDLHRLRERFIRPETQGRPEISELVQERDRKQKRRAKRIIIHHLERPASAFIVSRAGRNSSIRRISLRASFLCSSLMDGQPIRNRRTTS